MLKANHPAGFPLRKKRFREKSPNERFPCHLAFAHYLLKKTDMALPRICPFPLFIIYSGETIMFTISETASHELEAYFADKEKTPIRVYLAAGG